MPETILGPTRLVPKLRANLQRWRMYHMVNLDLPLDDPCWGAPIPLISGESLELLYDWVYHINLTSDRSFEKLSAIMACWFQDIDLAHAPVQ